MTEFLKPFLTRRAVVQRVNDVKGIPLKLSSFAKLAMRGEAPEPDAYYGKVELYKPETVEQWAEERLLSRKPQTLNINGRKDQDAAVALTSAPPTVTKPPLGAELRRHSRKSGRR